jgi:hypothetical protein
MNESSAVGRECHGFMNPWRVTGTGHAGAGAGCRVAEKIGIFLPYLFLPVIYQ